MSTCKYYSIDGGFFSTYYICALKQRLDDDRYITYDEKCSFACDTYESDRERNCPYLRRERESSSGCFITTACTAARGLPDDCYELTLFRNFRDTYLKTTPNGEKDIKIYYNTAPALVEKVNSLPNANEVWDAVYNDLVLRTVKLIEDGKKDEAYEYYKTFALNMMKEYGMDLSDITDL